MRLLPTQAKRFFECYGLLIHQPNTDSSFFATLFGEKRKQKNIESKEVKHTKEYGYINYIFDIRGIEINKISQFYKDLIKADLQYLAQGKVPLEQYNDMIQFCETCTIRYPQIKEKESLTLTGHSLGGCLAQMLTLSYSELVEGVYTYNAHLESKSVA